jgi:hypothetical protein
MDCRHPRKEISSSCAFFLIIRVGFVYGLLTYGAKSYTAI